MFSNLWPEKLSAPWRLTVQVSMVLGVSIITMFFFVRLAMNQDMRSLNRNRVSETVVQLGSLYDEMGLSGLKRVFRAGVPIDRFGLRVTTSSGNVIHEDLSAPLKEYPWPDQPRRTLLGQGDMDLVEIPSSQRKELLYLGVLRLRDGNNIWLGCADVQARRHMDNVERHLLFAGATATLIAFLPVMWFLSDVIRPILSFTVSAERMRIPGSRTRLRAPKAIPELKALASVVNSGLDQIQTLTRELQSTNDFLAHELRTPLARIRGTLESLHDDAEHDDVREAAARGLEEIDRATQLVQTLLTIRAGDHAALRLHRQQTSIDQLLTNLVELFVPAAEDRKLGLTMEPGLSLTLNMDRELITQAVSNLLDNALAYTRAGGHVNVRLQGEGTGVVIVVEDNGPGMRPDELEAIWDRYTRGSAARPKTSGMGLGLSLVRSIAMAHGGNAGCQNRESGGALFWIYIPGA